DGGSDSFAHVFNPLSSDPWNKRGLFSSNGILSLISEEGTIELPGIIPSDETVKLAYIDSNGTPWCVTDKFRLHKLIPQQNRTEVYDIPQWQLTSGMGESVNYLFHSMQDDNDGYIWIGTTYGLVRIDPADKHGYRLYNTGRKFDYYRSTFKDSCGNLYFAYSNGLTVFDPVSCTDIVSNADINFSLQLVLVNNTPRDVLQAEVPEFRYTDNTMTFICNYVDFDNLQTRYVWKLEGVDEEWTYSTVKYASYPNLPHGRYTFKLKMEGMPDSFIKTYSFIIKRKPWTGPWAILLYISTIIAFTATVTVYFYRRRARRRKERIMEMNKQLDNMKLDLFTNLSHEFRTPLTLISVPMKDMLYDSSLNEETASRLRIMNRSVEKLQRLTDQLLEYDKMSKDMSDLSLKRKDIVRDVMDIAENFQYTAAKNGSRVTVNSPAMQSLVYDDIKFGRIMSNLLNNAIKYSPDGGDINITLSVISANEAGIRYGRIFDAECLEVVVADHGKGIPEEKLDSIFFKYTRAEDPAYSQVQGFGIGLHYTRQLVQIHGGCIKAEQNSPNGAIFRFVIPMNLTVDDSTESGAGTFEAVQDVPETVLSPDDYEGGLSILVVEDNDDMREYIMNMFSSRNTVVGAADGQKGLEAIRKLYFDIVISDVMMPVMDGYSLCKAVREDKELCAISIVLLTAKTDTGSQIMGLDYGADGYVGKPFDPMYLRALINNIAKRRREHQSIIAKTTSATIDEVPKDALPESKYDQTFLKEFYACLDKQLDREEIEINEVVREMGMSRTGFYTKVKSLTGQSPLQFINEYRMSRAADLLKSGQYSIKEVAYMVGYQERRSFTNRFKQSFGCTPTEYISNNQ
ncbi:MAG: response regulator, partial [Candidatus Cryptobacteroides sp.]